MAGVLPATLRVALRSKIAPGDFVMAGVLPATVGVALRSKIALSSASCLAKSPASAIHCYGVRLFPPLPGDFVKFRPLPPEYNATPVCNQELIE